MKFKDALAAFLSVTPPDKEPAVKAKRKRQAKRKG
jgi:hypothetical protein